VESGKNADGQGGATQEAARLSELVTLLAAVGGAHDLEAALRVLATGAVALLGGHQAAIRVYDAEGPGRHAAFWVQPDGSLEEAAHVDPPAGSVAAQLRAGAPARIIDDLWQLDGSELPHYAELRRRGMRSSVAVPILAAAGAGTFAAATAAAGEAETRIGSLHVDHREVGHFSAGDLRLAEALAALAGAAIDRARLASARERAAAAERERARLDGALLVARTVAHELNNALAPVGGFAELLSLAPAVAQDAVLASYARLIQDATQTAAAKIRRLNALVRLEETPSVLGEGRPLLDLDRSAGGGT
jgi:GAF domain-containing protein